MLSRQLGLRTVVSTSAGLAFAAVNFLAVVQVAAYTGAETVWIAVLTAGVLCAAAALMFSELASRHPTAAGIRLWLRRGLSDRFSLAFTLVYVMAILIVVAADAFVLGTVVHAAVPALPGVVWVIAALSLILLANLRGVRMAGTLQDWTAFVLLGALLVISVASLAAHGIHPAALWPPPNGVSGVVQGIAEGVFIFVGFEWVTPLAEEVRNPAALTPGMLYAVGLLVVVFGMFALSLTALLPAAHLKTSLTPQLLVGRSAFGAFGFWVMAAITAVTAVTTFNGAFVSGSRLLFALAREHVLWPSFTRLNRSMVPDVALLWLYGLSLVLAAAVSLTGRYEYLINLGAAIEAAMYSAAALSLLGLRRREGQTGGFFRAPGGSVLPWALCVMFVGLAVVSATLPDTSLPYPAVPWGLVVLTILTALSVLHVTRVAPALRAQAEAARRARRPAPQSGGQ